MALVSAIVPIYNPRPDHLDEALGSILSQETDIEAIVVNDGSTERSFDNVLEKHGSIVFIEQKNTGVAGARNAGLFAASGEYVAFLDQDDRWRPGKLRKQLAVFKNNPEAGVVFHPVNYIDGDGKPRKANPASERRLRRRRLSKDTLGALLEGNFIFSPTVLARKSCFEKTGGFDSTVDPHDDWDMWLRLAMAGFQFVNIEEPLADWRIHPGNTSCDKSRMLRTRIAVVDKLERGGALPDHLHRALVRARAECHVTLAHSLYKEKRYDGFREEIKAAAGVDWKAAAKFKILRRWLRSVILGRAGA